MSFWRGRRVLVTGHTGFKGAWLVMMLLRLGARVSGFALAPATQPNLFGLLALDDAVDSTIGDVRDAQAVTACIARNKPDAIFHLAAQALVRASYEFPVETYATNVLGTANVLQAARAADVRDVIVVTSDKCYRNDERAMPYREDDPLGGDDPYSSSKGAAELVTHAYAASYGTRQFRVASARAGNVIGGGDWSQDRLIPDIVRAISDDTPLVLRYPNAVRPWQHVLEPLSGYLRLAETLDIGDGGAWNFGPQKESHVTVLELAQAMYRAMEKAEHIEVDESDHLHEATALRLDSTKARERLAWSSKLDARDAVEWTARWYREVAAGMAAHDVTVAQIEEYAAL
jgi:CDP-glucose 4,6-dehydratase